MINIKNIKTVSEINKEIQSIFDQKFLFVRIVGEISNLRCPVSGHMYFNLKDTNAQIRAVLFKNYSRYLKQDLKNGQQIVCEGRITLYAPRGDYQIVVESVDFQGTGDLQLEFLRLKEKLLGEGLFDPANKIALPDFPEHIIVITSQTGAALQDFLYIYKKRKSNILIQILPVRVQGAYGAEEIVAALSIACASAPDAIVLCRGGGSIEDLWNFNEEIVARAISDASIPIVTGIGHETDYTIADFCADYRCATPTAAAELLIPETAHYIILVDNYLKRLNRSLHWRFESTQLLIARANRVFSSFDGAFYNKSLTLDILISKLLKNISLQLENKGMRLNTINRRFEKLSPIHSIELTHYRLQILLERLTKSMAFQINKNQSHIQEIAAILDSVSPLATLSRGYAIASKIDENQNIKIITDSFQVSENDKINIKLKKGELECIVSKRLNRLFH